MKVSCEFFNEELDFFSSGKSIICLWIGLTPRVPGAVATSSLGEEGEIDSMTGTYN